MPQNKSLEYLLDVYLKNRPLFLSLIRAKEAFLFQKYLPLKDPVLDLGCGDGFFAKIAFEALDIGLDIEDSRIDEVEEGTYKKKITYNGKTIPKKDSSVNTVVSNCVLEHIPNLDETISEVYRILKPNGKFIVSVVSKPWEDNLFGALLLGNPYKNWMRHRQVHFNMNTYEKWINIFREHGFKINSAVGYLSPNMVKIMDVSHYLSIPNLLFYKLFGKWNPSNLNLYPVKPLVKFLSLNVEPEKSGAIFFSLTK